MKQLATAISAIALLASMSIAIAAPHPAKIYPAAKVNGVIHCPVTGATIKSPKDAYNSAVYNGKTYYFCCAGCKPLFEKNPQKYVKGMAQKAAHPGM